MESKTMTTKTGMTWEEFLAAGEEWQRWEYADGDVEFMSPVHLRHQAMIVHLIALFVKYREQHPEWLCFPGDATFTMASENWRCPHLSIVRAERFPGGKIQDAAGDFPPDIVFEILSTRDNAGQIQRKRQDYQESGVIQVWINPKTRLAELIYPERPAQFFGEDQPVVIDKLPDFSLNLKNLFSV
jgi:Uma2 family endonuclease